MRPSFLDKSKPASGSRHSIAHRRSRAETTSSKSPNRLSSRKTSPSRSTRPRKRVRADTSPPVNNSRSTLFNCTNLILIFLISTGALIYIKRNEWGISNIIKEHLAKSILAPTPNPEKYKQLTAQLESERTQLRLRYSNARTGAEREAIISEASELLENILPEMMRCWLGHPWDFNGVATVPGEGKIACGYFITTIMRDAGFKIDRVRLAQQASQNIIRTFVEDRELYEIKTNTPYPKYIEDISKKYEGIHIVGLDKHVAFIVIKDGEMRFIHSGGKLKRVVDEGRDDANSLQKSNYRVISNISRNENVIKKWILGETFVTVE